LCDRVIVSIVSGKLSFHDWKSQEILLQKTCMRNPGFKCLHRLHVDGIVYTGGDQVHRPSGHGTDCVVRGRNNEITAPNNIVVIVRAYCGCLRRALDVDVDRVPYASA